MRKIKVGVICPADIAYRRFMPALCKINSVEFVGVAIYSLDERFDSPSVDTDIQKQILESEIKKAKRFIEAYGGKLFYSYRSLVTSEEIDAVYIPLPPALHYTWAKLALEYGKHVLVEKPSTISLENTKDLVSEAEKRGLALHENYMFIYHSQVDMVDKIILSGKIGSVRQYQMRFGFPKRGEGDFRYVRKLGGGALNDAGGYAIKYASHLLGKTGKIRFAQMNYVNGFEVDMYGSAVFSNAEGVAAYIGFGMDNDYKCDLEVWGSLGTLTTKRIFTAPDGFEPVITIEKNGMQEIRKLSSDDAFKKSIEVFLTCIEDKNARKSNYHNIMRQAILVNEFREKIRQ